MKRINILSLIGILSIALISCSKERKEINDFDPNQFSDSDPTLMITGAQMANVLFNEGEAARLAGIFSGHFTGADRQYISYQNYSIVAGDFDNIWGTVYAEGIAQCRLIKEKALAANNMELHSVAAITEAHLLLTASGLWGDIPNSEACDDAILMPKYDKMDDVHQYCIGILDSALPYVEGSSAFSSAYVGGHNWAEVAQTLKARALLRKGDYTGAQTAAENGIQAGKDLLVDHSADAPGAWNLFFDFCYWNRGGYMVSSGSHLSKILNQDSGNTMTRSNDKTDESQRYGQYYFSGTAYNYSDLDPNFLDGIFASNSPFALVTYVENELILAECASRAKDDATALAHLNNVRSFNQGIYGDSTYLPYDLADFGSGQMVDGTDASDALLHEILEEKYVSLFGQIETFVDMRRTKNELDIPLNTGSQAPQRFLFPQSEINSNDNVPTDQLDLFMPLEYFK